MKRQMELEFLNVYSCPACGMPTTERRGPCGSCAGADRDEERPPLHLVLAVAAGLAFVTVAIVSIVVVKALWR